ncbi:hypothetical protein INT08_11060 [Prosthecochloris sp. N3]|uniref:Flagellar assembly factor FliW n=1 Tax=Prosthecochloris ethylica TaxID=2743976 RepID=A0ABR9XUS2_9CHLB|nr:MULTISPECIES: hypothetical protein [Prosthecochloris]MEC9486240.1 hypothetical protein [Prosthecochloris sp.]MBF0587406.1 hypothetical protein [Prosthecochloris ethylica]MBF0637700.1 hypothetical protein [Prosthecochloris ethylica]NUK48621.1 hypothetical protein [Prosthecochloris ethylica]RNA71456.1 hypothetical protein CR163_000060 [Prosthecochloris sp. ZM_2]
MAEENPQQQPQHRLNFALVNIKTEQLDIHPEAFKENANAKINTGINFGVDNEKKLLKVFFKNVFFHSENEKPTQEEADSPFIDLTVSCVFAIDPESWNMLSNEEKNLFVLPKDVAGHFASIVQSTARGILHNETENTDYNRYMIPANNIGDVIKDHVRLPLRKGENQG